MNWYQTITAEQKVAFDFQGFINKPLGGALAGAILGTPLFLMIVVNALNTTPQQAQQIIDQEPQKAQQIVDQAPTEIIEKSQREIDPQENVSTTQNQPQSTTVSVESLAPFVAQWEGMEPYAYPDGNSKSVGYGFYLGNASSRETLESVGANFDAVFSGQQPLSEPQMSKLLQIGSQRAIHDAKSAIPSFDSHPLIVQTIMADMAYTLGNKISQFPKMLQALEDRDYNKVADEMMDSKWFSDVGNRAKNHVEKIRSLVSQNP